MTTTTPPVHYFAKNVTKIDYGSTYYCRCSDCYHRIPGAMPVSLSKWLDHVAFHARVGVSKPSAPLIGVGSLVKDSAGQKITLNWGSPSSDGELSITGYRVARDGTDIGGTGPWSTVMTPDSRSITFTGLQRGVMYQFSVTAINAFGESSRAMVSGALEVEVTPPPTASETLWLPFNLPEPSVLRAKTKKVFAHYMASMPHYLGQANTYWTQNYVPPLGEKYTNAQGVVVYPHARYAGFVRDWPYPDGPAPSADDKYEGCKIDIQQAIKGGIDGFALNIMVMPPSTNWQPQVVPAMLRAANNVDPGFRVLLELDMNSGWSKTLTPTQIAAYIASITKMEGANTLFHINGKLAITAFLTENYAPEWYVNLFNLLKVNHAIDVAFMPTYLNMGLHAPRFRPPTIPQTVAEGDWGDRNVAYNDPSPTGNRRKAIAATKAAKLACFTSVSVEDQRPRDGIFDESSGLGNLRVTWKIAIEGGVEMVQLVTWNDYAEGSVFASSFYHREWRLLANAYYLGWYKMEAPLPIVRDGVVLSHRRHLVAAQPTFDPARYTMKMALRGGTPAMDVNDVMVFLKAEAEVIVRSGTNVRTYTAPPGVSSWPCSLANGKQSVSIKRGSSAVIDLTSPHECIPDPIAQDMQYVAAGFVAA